jgi:pyridoxamine 5'-phosphate oxidase
MTSPIERECRRSCPGRQQASFAAVDERDLHPDPIAQFRIWIVEAAASSSRPDAMTLATATADGRPSARIVLLRGADERGFVFFTNRDSRKAGELSQNPWAALVFHWYELGRQVRVEGRVEEVAREESDAYWQTRPRASRIAASASPQSRPIGDRAELDRLYSGVAAKLGERDVPLPSFWGGYRVVPAVVEFWLHHDDRLHDRVRYVRDGSGWRRERLAP